MVLESKISECLFQLTHFQLFFSPSLPKISCPIEGTATRTDVAFYFMPGAEQWYKHQSWLIWHPFKMMKLFDSLA
jgi:hypothetical protein